MKKYRTIAMLEVNLLKCYNSGRRKTGQLKIGIFCPDRYRLMSNLRREITRTTVIILAIFVDAVGVNYFLLPYDFPVGGITGISRVLHHFFGLSISTGVAILSVTLFVLGFFLVGKAFAMKTLIATIAYPGFLKILELMPSEKLMIEDRLLAGIISAILMGVGIGLCVRNGSSTGGTDLIGVVVNKFFHVPVATVTYIIDAIVLATQMMFGNFEDILYGIFILMLMSIVMNKVITMGGNNVQFFIVSQKYAEINAAIQEDGKLGTTLLHAKTGRFGEESEVIICTVKASNVSKIQGIIYDVDEAAFVTMMNVGEVYGRGFSMERIFKDPA